jgi:nucleotide-binding universal stress UspA family protein
LRWAGLPGGLDAKVLTVADVWLPNDSHKLEPVYPDVEAKAIRRARAHALEALKQAEATAAQGRAELLRIFPDWNIRAAAVADSPAWAIVRMAREFHADLVVVGAQGRSMLERLFLGSVAQRVAVEAPCSVRVGRPRPDHPPRRFRVLVAVDGSADSEAAIRVVLNREWRFAVEFRLVTVIDERLRSAIAWPGGHAARWVTQYDKDPKEWVCRMVEEPAKRIYQAGLDVETYIYSGDPKHVLLNATRELEADCVFIGAHGLHHNPGYLSLGTVASAVAARAPCAVEIVRAA